MLKKFVIGYLATGVVITELTIAVSDLSRNPECVEKFKFSDDTLKSFSEVNKIIDEDGFIARAIAYATVPVYMAKNAIKEGLDKINKHSEKSGQNS